MTLTKIPPNKIYQIIPKYTFDPSYTITDLDLFDIYDQVTHSKCVACVMKFVAEYYDYIYNKNKSITNTPSTTKLNISVNSLYYEARINDEIGTSNDYLDMGTTVYAGLYALSNGFTLDSTQPGQTNEEIWTDITSPPPSYKSMQKYNFNLTYGSNVFSVKRDVSDVKFYLHFNLPIIFSIKLNKYLFNSTKNTYILNSKGKKIDDNTFASIGSKVYSPITISSGKYWMHCLVIVGYDDSKKAFICRNSYGTNFGEKGYFYMDYSFLNFYDEKIKKYLIDDMYVII
jgi:C1A family cysteine protease